MNVFFKGILRDILYVPPLKDHSTKTFKHQKVLTDIIKLSSKHAYLMCTVYLFINASNEMMHA